MIDTIQPNLPNLEWLARLSDDDLAKVKTRYADFIRFTSDTIIKEVARIALMTKDATYQNEFATLLLKELAADASLPEAFRKKALEELVEGDGT